MAKQHTSACLADAGVRIGGGIGGRGGLLADRPEQFDRPLPPVGTGNLGNQALEHHGVRLREELLALVGKPVNPGGLAAGVALGMGDTGRAVVAYCFPGP